ncbi:HlyC/CorC family transporter [Azospirillum halopraeferens]|uniref:HlyC/CorC family transporter n=1 Tax=Azospirillum halopraeferens TaxID=34010 RepID=UPI0004206680|nr:HlyC/CorC family transporter [Azospirillum halopraeferens]
MDPTLWLSVGAIVVLLALSGFFSGSETALTAASRPRMHQLEQEGNARAGLVNRLRERKERVIGAILLGNNLVNILASALATSVLINLFGDSGVAYATLGMTVLVVVFSEVMPKTYTLNHADRSALAVARPIAALVWLFGPVTAAVGWIVAAMFRLFGADIRQVAVGSSAEELRGAIELHRGEDSAEQEDEEVRHERAMLRSILDLAEVEVSEIMTHRRNVVMIDATLPPARIADEVLASPFTRLPLWKDETDNVIGVLHAKALLREVRARGGNLDELDVTQIAARPWFIPDTTTLFDQLQAFRQRREHFALVVDEYGSLMGVVTLEDILEEIVGDISDELDARVAGVRPQPNGAYIIDGWVTLRDLNRQFEWRLPDDKASTIAGLVLYEARRIPQVGQVFTFYGFRFEILRRQRNQITVLRVTPPPELRRPFPKPPAPQPPGAAPPAPVPPAAPSSAS